MLKKMFLALLLIAVTVSGCDNKTKEELLQEGIQFSADENYRGAIVLFKNALEKDPNFIKARLLLGDAYLESGKYQNAEKEFQKTLRQDPSNKDIVLKLATVYIKTRSPDKTISILDENFSSPPQNVKALELLGRAYAIKGDLKTSEQMFRSGIIFDPTDSLVKLGLARLLWSQKRNDESRHLLNEVIAGDKGNVTAHYYLAELESSEGHVDQALEYYQQLTQLNDKDVTAHFRSGLFLLFKGDIGSAGKKAERIMGLSPKRPEGSRLMGLVNYVNGDYEAASVSLLNSLKLQPHVTSFFYLGLSYYALQNYELALSQFQKTLDMRPSFVKARTLSAMTFLKQNRVDDAISQSYKAIEIDPSNAFAHHILGSAYLKKGMLDEGMTELEQATRLDPELVGPQLQKGLVHIAQGKTALGEEDLVQALKMAPEIQNTRLLLLSHYLRQQNYSAAITTVNEGLTGDPVDGLLYNILAGAYFAQGKAVDAVNALNKSKAANPDYFTPYYNLASYYSSKGEYALARKEYLAILERDSVQTKALLSLASLSNLSGEQDQIAQYLDQARTTGAIEAYLASALYLVNKKQFTQSLQTVNEGLSLHPESIALIELNGKLLSRSGDVQNAEKVFTELARLDSERGTPLLIRHYLQHGTAEQATKVARRFISEEPGSTTGYQLLAGIQSWQKEYSAAFQTLENGLIQVKERQRLEMQIGSLYEKTDEDINAKNIYEKITERLPDYAPALFARASIFHRHGDMRKAQDLYRQVLKQSPDYIPALNNMAYLLTDNFGRSQEALDMALKAYRKRPNDPYIMDTLGYVLMANDRSKDAISVLQEAVSLAPNNPTMNLHLGTAYANLGKEQEAQSYLKMVSEKGSTDEVEQAAVLLKKK